MAATKQDIERWFDNGVKDKEAFLIVVCDTFDWDDYPVYAGNDRECMEKYYHFNGPNMQKVMEVYDLAADKSEQLNEGRVFRLPKVA